MNRSIVDAEYRDQFFCQVDKLTYIQKCQLSNAHYWMTKPLRFDTENMTMTLSTCVIGYALYGLYLPH